jgi:hypothetical protein
MESKTLFGITALLVGGVLIYLVIKKTAASNSLTVGSNGVSGNINLTSVENGLFSAIGSAINSNSTPPASQSYDGESYTVDPTTGLAYDSSGNLITG